MINEKVKKALDRLKSAWGSMEKQHKLDEAKIIYDACKEGCSVKEIAKAIFREHNFVKDRLNLYAFDEAGGTDALGVSAGHPPKRDELNALIQKCKSQPNPDYVQDYVLEGCTEEVAKTLATTYAAVETAIDKGVIKEKHEQSAKKTDRALFGPGHQWQSDLLRLTGQIKSAARTLDQAQIGDLRKVGSRKAIASAHAKWMEQIARLQNFHHDFDSEVLDHAT